MTETDAAKLLIQATRFSSSSLLLPPPAGAPGGDADTAVLPMGCGCWGMAQLLLLPPGWEEVERRKSRAIADPLVVGRIMGAVGKLRAKLSSSSWNKCQWGATMVTEHKRKNFIWHLPFLQANEEEHQSADRLLIFIAFSQQLWYLSSYSGSSIHRNRNHLLFFRSEDSN